MYSPSGCYLLLDIVCTDTTNRYYTPKSDFITTFKYDSFTPLAVTMMNNPLITQLTNPQNPDNPFDGGSKIFQHPPESPPRTLQKKLSTASAHALTNAPGTGGPGGGGNNPAAARFNRQNSCETVDSSTSEVVAARRIQLLHQQSSRPLLLDNDLLPRHSESFCEDGEPADHFSVLTMDLAIDLVAKTKKKVNRELTQSIHLSLSKSIDNNKDHVTAGSTDEEEEKKNEDVRQPGQQEDRHRALERMPGFTLGVDVIRGDLIDEGGFCAVFHARIKEPHRLRSRASRSQSDSKSDEEETRQYVIKHLLASAIDPVKELYAGAKDLALEMEFMAALDVSTVPAK